MFHKKKELVNQKLYPDYESLKWEVNAHIAKALRQNPYEMVRSQKELEANMKFKRDLRKAIRGGAVGNHNAKIFIRDFMKELLVVRLKISEEQLDNIFPFSNPYKLSSRDKFSILLYHFERKYGVDAFNNLMEQYRLATPRLDENKERYYEISETDIEEIYQEEGMIPLSYVDKVNIISQRIYEDTKGNGPIDELFYLALDGISGGVSGNVLSENDFIFGEGQNYSYQSIWIFYQGKSIYLSFLHFASQKEFIRICKNIYRYHNPGQLSQKRGYIVTEMADGSRVAVSRPPFCESWVFFIRKFNSVCQKQMDALLVDKNKRLPIQLIKWAIKGCQNIGITGEQGSGKTTLLMSMVNFMKPSYNLRVQEIAFELHLRKLYPTRNIVSFRETNTIAGQEGLDFQKKTDGTVNILGEVASNEVCSWMVQMAQVASNFTVFTHHAKTTKDLLYSFRNALLMKGGFSEERIALEQVVHVIHFDIHMKKAEDGHRYIERITEIRERESGYGGASAGMFETRDLILYRDGGYIIANNLSDEAQGRMMAVLTKEEKEEFINFLRDFRGRVGE